ncbi:aldo/keto reductase [Francisella sp. Scap27]|uniref:aldo/keto reductase n=1 Tax=Francisella sp. Scap27 TaxID=2589986 RepID=UPI0015BACE5D|nr:aldo/keto reductase [Francisella sp. Scap27]QLE79925.1 aldo/keto reductase [Francisella sp. Scap27]
MKEALDNSINHFDTADGYAYGANEVFLGKHLNLKNTSIRKNLIIASKAGILRDKNDPNVRGICIEPKYLREQLNHSLKNLQTNYLDIFYVHRLPPNANEQKLEVLGRFLKDIREEGLVKSVGLSEPNLEQLKILHQITSIDFVQSEYSLLERIVENNGILDMCKSNSINFVAYSPLCRGMLTDTFSASLLQGNDFRQTLPKFTGNNYTENMKLIEKLKVIADSLNISLSTLSLSWLISQNVLVIPGMRKTSRIKDSLIAYEINLNKETLERIDSIAHHGATHGTRYSQSAMDAYGFE